MEKTKPFNIPKQLFVRAYKLVEANAGAAGVDEESLEDFAKDLKNNLYKLWNRMSSGSYFPPAVKAVPIPKKSGGERILGIPTVADRIAQMVVKLVFEPCVEPHFHPDSYGYRPNKSALDAVGITRQRCWRNNWVMLYIERWLVTPMQLPDGTLQEKVKGVMQGGVISPVLSNLFLHYVFDSWMTRSAPETSWCRYADDGLVHCKTESEAQRIRRRLEARFIECGLEMHPDKTKIVYCKDSNRRSNYKDTSFDFLGFTFRPREAKNQRNGLRFTSFTPAVSKTAMKAMRAKIKKCRLGRRTELSIQDIVDGCNPILQGWVNYYGQYHITEMESVFRHFNQSLVKWAMRKYIRLNKRQAIEFLSNLAKDKPRLFVHWDRGRPSAFA
ncbi:TPA: group II intron reverse transcriptase/maturase [Legionella pneumophila]|uniref:Group II intron reverse transcriptase/maturase n=2 Tax=Legionella pneumophila TaxID=446 RepID=A0A2S6F3H2_LEGPN|nr:group II intron reverse transcriptase/maturase [Legionella pneumophila]APF02504.1 group II intron reverse transcriptase/maturase [Legionella pneumophila subsp. fraseri]APF05514.1 group II intron reverse transcriptase/maturase [Legionella pneumophila subsp. fraseri]AUB67986.1 group II intron reverse transcriptase/maturase [Legionella pneumophila]AUB70958.1 group II intron reverse transcriptase/maturase [Legionella pneumophila]KXB23707.1 DNA polymerase [Legionella pneumophila]